MTNIQIISDKMQMKQHFFLIKGLEYKVTYRV